MRSPSASPPRPERRLTPRAVFLDGGGTIVLPHRHLVAGALASAGADVDPATIAGAHYRAARALGRDHRTAVTRSYPEAPEPRIFEVALARAGVDARDAVHVGDMVTTDVAGAARPGIVPIHLDPARTCREGAYRHLRSLSGIWRHVAAAVQC